MNTSLFELFKIGIGPSSSHTVGPMRASLRFAQELREADLLERTERVEAHLYGSLALTGIGHGTDRAVLLGLLGEAPDSVDPALVAETLERILCDETLPLLALRRIHFVAATDLIFHRDQMYPDADRATHPNGIRFRALDQAGKPLLERVFYSIGGGFIVEAADFNPAQPVASRSRSMPFPFSSAEQLLAVAETNHLSIAELMMRNECALLDDASIRRPGDPGASTDQAQTSARTTMTPSPEPPSPEARVTASILALWSVMQRSIERGLATEGTLPGGLNVRRRAPRLSRRLLERGSGDPLEPMDWVTIYAMAVNEENAAGGRVVTAPTNGAAGVIPAIALYYSRMVAHADQAGLIRFFLTAAAIGILYKENASISGAEVGCQGEVGVACSMAAGGLAAALGGTNAQVEHAAEIAMEHNLGMTCDPIGGLVQIPCIERNGMGAVKAINAARLALADTDGHKLSLDQVIRTMHQTGLDMQSRYKETSLAGLALNIIEC